MGTNVPKQKSVPLMPNMEDVITVTFDKHLSDRTLLLVWKIINNEKIVINCLRDEQAEELYKQLVDWSKSCTQYRHDTLPPEWEKIRQDAEIKDIDKLNSLFDK